MLFHTRKHGIESDTGRDGYNNKHCRYELDLVGSLYHRR